MKNLKIKFLSSCLSLLAHTVIACKSPQDILDEEHKRSSIQKWQGLPDSQEYYLDLSWSRIKPEDLKGLKLQGTEVQYLDLSYDKIRAKNTQLFNFKDTKVRKVNLNYNKICNRTQKYLKDQYPHILWSFIKNIYDEVNEPTFGEEWRKKHSIKC